MLFYRGLWKDDLYKTSEAKNLMTQSLLTLLHCEQEQGVEPGGGGYSAGGLPPPPLPHHRHQVFC